MDQSDIDPTAAFRLSWPGSQDRAASPFTGLGWPLSFPKPEPPAPRPRVKLTGSPLD